MATTRKTTSSRIASSGARGEATALIERLETLAKSDDVFEAFEALDALPADVVGAALSERLGPVRAPEELDDATRLAHGFAAPPLVLCCTRVVKPARAAQLSGSEQEQTRSAGILWDGRDLPAEARLAKDAGDVSFAGTLEHRTIDDEDGVPLFDVVMHHGDSGAIFRAGSPDAVGVVADGVVEMSDARERRALQSALAQPTEEVAEAAAVEEPPAKKKAAARKKTTTTPKKKTATLAKKKTATTATAAKKTTTIAKKKTAATKPPSPRKGR
jgi:hypothetical protein